MSTYLPDTVSKLIDMLDKNYPYTLFKTDVNEREMWERIGQRKLIESLKTKLQLDLESKVVARS